MFTTPIEPFESTLSTFHNLHLFVTVSAFIILVTRLGPRNTTKARPKGGRDGVGPCSRMISTSALVSRSGLTSPKTGVQEVIRTVGIILNFTGDRRYINPQWQPRIYTQSRRRWWRSAFSHYWPCILSSKRTWSTNGPSTKANNYASRTAVREMT